MSETRRSRTRALRSLARTAIAAGTKSRRARVAMLGMAMGVTAIGSATATTGDVAAGKVQKQVSARKHQWFEIGKATWYGGDFNGRKTANGEVYNENELTCAHRTLPLGSWIRVTNLQNHRSAVVRVTDRGPWVKNAVLDLSHAAARTLGFSGSAKVRIDRVDRPHYTAVQVAQLEMPQKPGVAGQ